MIDFIIITFRFFYLGQNYQINVLQSLLKIAIMILNILIKFLSLLKGGFIFISIAFQLNSKICFKK